MTIYPSQSLTAYIINGLNLQSKHIDDCVKTNKKITKENTGGILVSDKIDFRSKTVTTEKRQHIMIKRINSPGKYNNYICSQHQSSQYMKQTLRIYKKEEIVHPIIIAGNFSIPF